MPTHTRKKHIPASQVERCIPYIKSNQKFFRGRERGYRENGLGVISPSMSWQPCSTLPPDLSSPAIEPRVFHRPKPSTSVHPPTWLLRLPRPVHSPLRRSSTHAWPALGMALTLRLQAHRMHCVVVAEAGRGPSSRSLYGSARERHGKTCQPARSAVKQRRTCPTAHLVCVDVENDEVGFPSSSALLRSIRSPP